MILKGKKKKGKEKDELHIWGDSGVMLSSPI